MKMFFAMIAILFFSNAVYAQNACYSGIVNVPSSAFVPSGNDISYARTEYDLRSSQTGFVTFHAPIMLPLGAKITRASLSAYDNDSSGYIYYRLNRAIGSVVFSTTTKNTGLSETPGDVFATSDEINWIVNQSYAYGIMVTFFNTTISADLKLYHVRIYYELYDCPGGVVVIPMF